MCTKDAITRQAVVDRINRIVFWFDPDSKQNGYGSYKHYDVKLTDGVLNIAVNLDKWNSDLYSFEEVNNSWQYFLIITENGSCS